MFEFENPAAFFLLLLIPVLYFLRYLKVFGHISFPLIISDWNGRNFSWNKPLRNFLSGIVHFLTLCGFISGVLAFANPVIHNSEKVYTSRGSEIFFVIDTSPSMAAKDIGGISRLDNAKRAVHVLAEENSGSTIGLVEMAKDAAVIVSPTLDKNFLYNRLDGLMVGELGDGTAIGTGLSTAIYHLENSSSPKKSIVLITDGENNAGTIHPNTAARLAKEKGISLYVLGIGTKGTVPLEYADPKTGHVYSGYLDSNYDINLLSKIAFEGDGVFYEVATTNALAQSLSSIAKNESVVQSYHIKNVDHSLADHFLALSGILLILAWIVRRLLLQEVL